MNKDHEISAAEIMFAIRLGIDDGVFRRQDEWRSFPATFIGVDLHALSVAINKSVELSLAHLRKPKPVAWPHLPEVDRPDSEVQP